MKITTKIAYSLLPPYVWSILTLEPKLTWGRWSNILLPKRRRLINRFKQLDNQKIHLGCGSHIFPDWINVDGLALDGVDLQWDLRYSLPFGESSTKMIYSEHVLEHLFKSDALKLLRECYRILKPGGTIRLGVPDAELYLRAYSENRTEFFNELKHLGGAVVPLSTPIEVINQMFRMGGHHLFAWDFSTLSGALESVGFVNINRWNPGEGSCHEICLDDPAHAFETLYVEASKPCR